MQSSTFLSRPQCAAAGAEIIPIPLPARVPPPSADPARAKQAPALGWHGMDILSIEVDHKLIADSMHDGSAVKIGVAPGTPAARAGLRTGDYVLTVGQQGRGVPLNEFDRLHLPAFTQVIVRFHRPRHHRAGEAEMKLLKLARPPGRKRAPWWERFPKVECGREVQPGKDRAAFAGQMSGHPNMPEVALKILIRLLSYYDGKDGAYPSYSTLARDAGCRRRNTAIENVRAGVAGVLQVRKFAGGSRLLQPTSTAAAKQIGSSCGPPRGGSQRAGKNQVVRHRAPLRHVSGALARTRVVRRGVCKWCVGAHPNPSRNPSIEPLRGLAMKTGGSEKFKAKLGVSCDCGGNSRARPASHRPRKT